MVKIKIKEKSANELKKYLDNSEELDKSIILEIKKELIYREKENKEIRDNLPYSKYYNVAFIYMEKKGIKDPSDADLFEAFHELAKVDHRINKKKNN